MNRYVSYKDSGVEWIGKIPHHWETGKLKHNSDLRISSVDKHILEEERKVIVCNYTDVYYNEFITSDLPLRKGSCSENEYTNFLLKKGDVIITKDSEIPTDIGVPSLVKDNLENVVCGYHLSIMKPHKTKLVGNYLFRQLQTKRIRSYFEINSNGITRFGLGKSSVLETLLILPSYSEQEQIVSFLDDKTQKIDSLIQQKEKKIELLKEKRTSLINHVVTKGLDPNVEMKDSGVEWIGEIPNHWEHGKIKFFVNYKKGYPFKSENMSDEGLPIIKVTSVKKLKINSPKTFYNGELLDKITIVKEGDIIITTVGSKYEVSNSSVGQLGLVEKEQNEFLLNQNTVSIRIIENSIVNNVFIFMCFQSKRFRNYLDIHSHGTVNQSSLNINDILNFNISYPSYSEQQQIVEYLNKQTEEIDTLIQLEQKKIYTLKEYRQSLISEVVTGKIRVCEEDNSLSLNSQNV